MAQKPNPAGRKTKKSARPVPAAARAKSSPRQLKSAFYVTSSEMRLEVADTPPTGVKNPRQFATFDEAKSAAIDALVEAIERAERQLVVVKRANDCRGISSGP
jgi:hypothetical protein